MKVSISIEASASAFYNLLMDSIIHDIKQATNKKVTMKDLVSGYKYKKKLTSKMGKHEKATVKLLKIERPYCYEASFTNARGTNIIGYYIKEEDEGYIEVTYSEEYTNNKGQLNFKLMSLLYQRRSKKRITNLLRQMEIYLQTQKDNENISD
jgi:hypothetical protein